MISIGIDQILIEFVKISAKIDQMQIGLDPLDVKLRQYDGIKEKE